MSVRRGEEEKGIVNKMQTVGAGWQRSGLGGGQVWNGGFAAFRGVSCGPVWRGLGGQRETLRSEPGTKNWTKKVAF